MRSSPLFLCLPEKKREKKRGYELPQKIWNKVVSGYGLTSESRVLCCFSGGADSTFLLHLLCEAREVVGFSLAGFYLNHQLRAEESEAEEEFVLSRFLSLSVTGLFFQRDVAALARKKKRSVEMAARACRREIIGKLEEEHRFTHIFTGHQLDDRAETLLYNLCRGTALQGAGSMPETEQRGNVLLVRPLLSLRRGEIRSLLQGAGITWFEDSSNKRDMYTRNRVRHHILPLLEKEVHPEAVSSLARSASLFQEAAESINAVVSSFASVYAVRWGDMFLLKREVLKEKLCTPYVLKELFKKMLLSVAGDKLPVTSSQLAELESVFRHPPKVNGSVGLWRQVDSLYAPEGMVFFLHENLRKWREFEEELSFVRSLETPFFRLSLQKTTDGYEETLPVRFPLRVRFRRGGEKVLCRHGKKRALKDLFTGWKSACFRRFVHPLVETEKGLISIKPPVFGGKQKGEEVLCCKGENFRLLLEVSTGEKMFSGDEEA